MIATERNKLNGHSRPIDYAETYRAAGLSTIAIRADQSKAPTGPWTEYQNRLPTESELGMMFLADNVGIAICYGAASGNAELIDIDSAELFEPYAAEVENVAPGLIGKLCRTKTPRPGYHLAYRCEEIEGNQKLARRPTTPEERQAKPEELTKVTIETRGRGGYALAPGSPAECHETGRLYEHVGGPPLTDLPTITPEERETLLSVARVFNEVVEEPAAKSEDVSSQDHHRDGLSPGDDYNARTSWADILSPVGWSVAFTHGDVTHWTRPGKEKGTSATTGLKSGHGADLLCVFTSNAHPFEGANGNKPCTTYTRFGAYALLHHAGDHSAAAKQLASEGYGDGKPSVTVNGHDFGEVPKAKAAAKALSPIAAPKPYPVDKMPPALGEYIADRAEKIDVCPSTIALPTLATCAAAIGNSRIVQVTPTWPEVCGLYTAIVARSGARKSPALEAAIKPLSDIDFDLADTFEDDFAKYQEERDHFVAQLKEWKKRSDGPRPEEPQQPPESRHVCSNITTEKLVSLLQDNPRGLLLSYDELSALFGNMDRYGGGAGVSGDAPLYLQAYSGKPYRHDRVTQGRSVRLRRPLLSIAGAIQPSILNKALGEDHRENGLLSRFLITYPAERSHKWVDDGPGGEVLYHDLMRSLLDLKPAGYSDGKITPEKIGLDDAASKTFQWWFGIIQEEKQLADDHQAAALAKLEGAAARVALIFHMVRAVTEDGVDAFRIDNTSMRGAIDVMLWQKEETFRAYTALAGDEEIRRRQRLATWIRERFPDGITVRELQRGGGKRYPDSGAAEQALNELSSAKLGGWSEHTTSAKGGRPTRCFIVCEAG